MLDRARARSAATTSPTRSPRDRASEPDWARAAGRRRRRRFAVCCGAVWRRIAAARSSDIGDARLEIDEALTPPSGRRDRRRRDHAASAAGARCRGRSPSVGVALGAAGRSRCGRRGGTRAAAAPLRLSAELGADASLGRPSQSGPPRCCRPTARVARVRRAEASAAARPQLYVRRLDQLQATPLAGTDGAQSPFFSPDGQWIAFFAGGKLKKIAVTGGAAVTLCDAPNGRGGAGPRTARSCSRRDSRDAGVRLLRVSAAGGTPRAADDARRGRSRRSDGRRCCRAARPCSTPPRPTPATSTTRTSWSSRCRTARAKVVQRGGYLRPLSAERASGRTSTTGRCLPRRSISIGWR